MEILLPIFALGANLHDFVNNVHTFASKKVIIITIIIINVFYAASNDICICSENKLGRSSQTKRIFWKAESLKRDVMCFWVFIKDFWKLKSWKKTRFERDWWSILKKAYQKFLKQKHWSKLRGHLWAAYIEANRKE